VAATQRALVYQPLSALRPYPRNARTHSKKQVQQIARSIERFGFTNPVLVSDEGEIIAGHGRVRAAALLGMQDTLSGLVSAIHITNDAIRLELKPKALGNSTVGTWSCTIPRPPGERPFREAKLKMDAKPKNDRYDADLVSLIAEAMEVQRLVLQSPELSLNQLGKREGRCRTHLARLLRISWLSPRIVEAVADGTQPKTITRKVLLSSEMPLAWEEQERMLGLAA